MGKVVQFERFKDVTGWSLPKIEQYIAENNLHDRICLHWRTDDERVLIERLHSRGCTHGAYLPANPVTS